MELQIKGGGFDGFLLLPSEFAEAIGEGISDAKFHNFYFRNSNASCRTFAMSGISQTFRKQLQHQANVCDAKTQQFGKVECAVIAQD